MKVGFGDRPKRDFGDRPAQREGGFGGEDRPKRSFGGEDRPKRSLVMTAQNVSLVASDYRRKNDFNR